MKFKIIIHTSIFFFYFPAFDFCCCFHNWKWFYFTDLFQGRLILSILFLLKEKLFEKSLIFSITWYSRKTSNFRNMIPHVAPRGPALRLNNLGKFYCLINVQGKILSKIITTLLLQRNWVFATNSDFLISIALQPMVDISKYNFCNIR